MTPVGPARQAVEERASETASPIRGAEQFETGHLKKGIGQRAVRGAAITMTSNGVRFVLETTRIVVLARLLQPADYGLVAMVTALTGVLDMFKDLGLNTATVTRQQLSHAQLSTIFWINAGFGLVLMVLTAAIAPLITWFYGDPRLLMITLGLSPSFLMAGLSVQHQALLRRQMKFGVLATARIIDVTSGLVVGVILAWLGAGYWALVAMPVTSAIASAIALWSWSGWRPGPWARQVGAREMVRFGGQVTGINLVQYFSRRFDQFMLGWWAGPTALGLYDRSTSLVDAPLNRAMGPISTVVLPTLSQLVTEPERYRAAYRRMVEMLCLVSMPGAAFMIGCSDWLIPFVLGKKWAAAAPIFAILSVLGFLRPIESSNWWLFTTQDRAGEGLRWSVIGALIAATSVLVGLQWGAIGVATSVTVASVLRLPLLVWYTTHTGPVRARDIYRTLATPTAAALVALGVLVLLKPYAESIPPLAAVIGGLVVTGAVFFAGLALLPDGRRTLRDAWNTTLSLRKRRRG